MKRVADKKDVVVYNGSGNLRIEVLADANTVWLNRQQLALMFGRDVKTIGKHIANALKEELKGFPVVAKFATTAADGKMYQVEYYGSYQFLVERRCFAYADLAKTDVSTPPRIRGTTRSVFAKLCNLKRSITHGTHCNLIG